MDSEEFVQRVRKSIRDAACKATIKSLQSPSGRRPPADLVVDSDWYNALNEDGRERVSSIIDRAADQVVFDFLCVLDGVGFIENEGEKGRFELLYIKDGVKVLNPPDGSPLHELY